MSEEFNQAEFINCVYKPSGEFKPKAIPGKMGVKFSKNVFLLKSFLDKNNISYEAEDLEETPFGPGIIIKRD